MLMILDTNNECIILQQPWFTNDWKERGERRGCAPLQGTLAISEDTVGCHISGVILLSGRQRTGILPNTLQRIGLLPMT